MSSITSNPVKLGSVVNDDAKQLRETVKDIYGADKYSSKLPRRSIRTPTRKADAGMMLTGGRQGAGRLRKRKTGNWR